MFTSVTWQYCRVLIGKTGVAMTVGSNQAEASSAAEISTVASTVTAALVSTGTLGWLIENRL